MKLLPLLLLPLAVDSGSEPDIGFHAYLDADSLAVDGEYELVVELELGEARSAMKAGIPGAIVQLEVPKSIELMGRRLETYRELARNEFLQEPYERLVKEFPARIPLKLVAEPGADETIGVNIVGYVATEEEGESTFFLRKRLEVPVKANGEAVPGDPKRSTWGNDEKLLHIGDAAADFTLPKADGTEVTLADYVGEKNVIVTTYRAFW